MNGSLGIAVVGGTGPQGRGLAYRFALAGHTVTIGSRDPHRAKEKAEEIAARAQGKVNISGASNTEAAAAAEVVLLAIPWDGHGELVASLADQLAHKVVISCVNPLAFDDRGPYGLTLAESAAEEAQRLVPEARVIGAFHHVAALSLWKTPTPLEHEDVVFCGDDDGAKAIVQPLASAVTGRPGVDAGALRLARQLEPLTAVLISINKRYKARSGIAITGVHQEGES